MVGDWCATMAALCHVYTTGSWGGRLGSLTGLHIFPGSGSPWSWTARTPSAAQRPPTSAPSSRAPGMQRAPWSGSPSGAARHGNAWPPRCSCSSDASTSRPGGGRADGSNENMGVYLTPCFLWVSTILKDSQAEIYYFIVGWCRG